MGDRKYLEQKSDTGKRRNRQKALRGREIGKDRLKVEDAWRASCKSKVAKGIPCPFLFVAKVVRSLNQIHDNSRRTETIFHKTVKCLNTKRQ